MAIEMLLIRHGQSEANVGLSDDPDCAMTPNGFEQARQMGRRLQRHDLRGFTALVSPYRRTITTAAEIAAVTGLAFEMDEGIREWGNLATINEKEYPMESIEELIERLDDFLRRYEGRKIIVVSHAAPIAVLTELAWGETPNTHEKFWAGVGNCCLRWLIAPPR